MPRFLPALRGNTAVRSAVRHAEVLSRDTEAKIVLADYYAALVNAGVGGIGRDRSRPWDVERAVAEGYERVVWSFAAVEAIAGSQARLEIEAKDGDQTVVDDPVVALLNKGKANPMETGHQLRKRLGAQVLLSKRGAFVEKSVARSGRPYRYDLLPPTRTRIVPGTGNDLVDHYELRDLGGRVVRKIDPSRVLWFRNPHVIDLYSGTTPLEAAGLSIELDYFARLYNVSFMRNDGRPGGILGVDGEMDENEMDRVESRFGKGPVEAGKLSVINGALTYVDTASKPRDLQYGTTSKNAKTEILVAFGVGETLLGNAADRTFANAKEEALSFWTVRPMPEHMEIILNGFAEDFISEGYQPSFVTKNVRALQELEAAERDEARTEYDKGLRSIISYARLVGREDEVDDTAQTRALWVPSGRTPIPASDEDAVALGVAPPIEEGTEGEGQGAGALSGPEAGGGADDTVAASGPSLDAGSAAQAVEAAGAPPPAIEGPRSAAQVIGEPGIMGKSRMHLAVVREPRHERKRTRRLADAEADEEPARESESSEALQRQVENALTAALDGVRERLIERAIARVKSPKSRKGTRHFAPEYKADTRVDTKALDAAKIVDEDRFAAEAQAAVSDELVRAADVSADRWVQDLGYAQAVEEAEDPGLGTEVLVGVAATAALLAVLDDDGGSFRLPRWLLRSVARLAVAPVLDLIGTSAQSLAGGLADLINEHDQAGETLDQIVEAVRRYGTTWESWARQVATVASTGTTEGARDAVAEVLVEREVIDPDITRMWLSRRDTKVRDSHRKADGQRQPMGSPFVVGEALLRFPGDPLGPPREVRNCRCRLLWRSKASGRFITPRGATG